MKKSCSVKESKVVTTKDAKRVLNASNEDSEKRLTEEQILINKKLLESGIEDQGLGWIEKTNIFNTINVSLDTAGNERLQRCSPRFTKQANSKAVNWIDNSLESTKHEDCDTKKVQKTKSSEDFEITPTRKFSPTFTSKKTSKEDEESLVKSNWKQELSESQRDVETSDTLKSSNTIHYLQVQVEEENSKVECNLLNQGVSQGLSLGKKRTSQPEIDLLETPKKLKMDEMNNGVSSQEESLLQVEVELEKKKNCELFKIRDIKTIVSECEIRNKKWKETYSKYKCPTRWGMPIVRNCTEKWDGKQIPPKLLHRFQKYLSANNLSHPIFLPLKLQSKVNLNKLNSEVSSESNTSGISECKVEAENNVRDSGGESFTQGTSNKIDLENNLSASTSGEETGERMVLRNRSQQKTIISDEEEFSSDDSDDWLVKQKSMKKQKFNAKNKKAADQSNKQLVLKLERCNINRGNGQETSRKNNKNDIGFTGGLLTPSNSLNQGCGNSKSSADPDTMVCPICSLRFKKQFIESHATDCASKTYKD